MFPPALTFCKYTLGKLANIPKAIQISEQSVTQLMAAMDAHLAYSKKSMKASLLYAVQKVLYHLRAATKKAKPTASTKQLEKVKGEAVLNHFPTIHVNKARDYWIAHSDRQEDNGALIPRWYLSCRKHSKSEAAKQLKRKHAGLAKLVWFSGLKKAKINAPSEAATGADTMSIASANVTFALTQNAIGWQAKITNHLRYATEALTSPNAVNNAVSIAAAEMMRNLKHLLEKKLGKDK